MNFDKLNEIRVHKYLKKYNTFGLISRIAFVILALIVVFLIISIITSVVNVNNDTPKFFGIFIPLIVSTLVLAILFYALRHYVTMKYQAEIKDDLFNSYFKNQYSDFEYTHSKGIKLSSIMEAGVLKKPDRSNIDDYLSGSYKGIKFEFSEINLQTVHESENGTSYQTYFLGAWFIFDLPKNNNVYLKICEKFGGYNSKLEKKINTESIEFNNKFNVYTDNEDKGFYLLTPVFINYILKLEEQYHGKIVIVFKNDKLHFGINSKSMPLDLKPNQEINNELLDKVSGWFILPKTIIDEFGLDSRKFNV